ncbi:NAD(P)H-dependent glycerol-3-phosphate dehydrogenase [Shigella flexneri]
MKSSRAVGAGMSDGIGFGANARTALIARGLAEMSRLGAALGADPATFMGMAGLGDLVLTCTDNQSHNRRWYDAGSGHGCTKARREVRRHGGRLTANTKKIRELAHRFGVEMPMTEEISRVFILRKKRARGSIDIIRSCTRGRAQQSLTQGTCTAMTSRAERAVISHRVE